MVTIKDVAKSADLSVATVSRFLNQKGYVSEEAKLKIEQAIFTLNYKPNQIARSLSTKQSNLIGLIVPDIKNPYFPELARAIEDTALQFDYTVVLCNADESMEKELLYIERLTQKYVAGLIVTTNLLDVSHYRKIDIPVVALDRMIDISIPTVATDNFEGAKIGTEYLIQCGAKKLVCLRGPSGLKPADDRLAGFLAAIQDKKEITYHIVEAGFDFHDSAKAVEKILQEQPDIDGLFASNDTAAIAALKIAHKLDKVVPETFQIVGFDGIEMGTMVSPELTTVAQDIYQMGTIATKMLIDQIEGKQIENRNFNVAAQLIVRGTTRKESSI